MFFFWYNVVRKSGDNVSRVVVIGGGASGMIAAIKAKEKHDVILLEANDKCGKKILLTGNGKCNYWNANIDINNYNSDNLNFLNGIISEENKEKVLSFLENISLYPKIKNGYYYPYSNNANSVRTIFLNELARKKVKIINNFNVISIKKEKEEFIIESDDSKIICDKVILATGSKACPKTGSDGSGYLLASSLGHTINKVTPALTPLIGNEPYFKSWDGVRCDSNITLFIDNKKICEELGEIQLTSYGVSGICIFNISGIVTKSLSQNKKVTININFLPTINMTFYEWFTLRNEKIPNHTIGELLESIIPYKLMYVLLKKSNVDENNYWHDLSDNKKLLLSKAIESFELTITSYHSFDRCQVATGGIPLNEINCKTMESTLVPNLYLVGEVLDVDGKCGGFNLAFAFISGYIAGGSV